MKTTHQHPRALGALLRPLDPTAAPGRVARAGALGTAAAAAALWLAPGALAAPGAGAPAPDGTWLGQLRSAAPALAASPAQDDEKERKKEFDQRYKDAKGDVAKLWELYDWCEAYGLQKYHARVLNAILKVDENDRRAHELLGHEFYDGKWWDDLKELEKYRLEKEREEAEAKGWVKYEGRWVDPADVPFLERGLVKDEDGNWVDPEVQKKLAEGWVRQDLEWIPPDQKENVEKGLWKCGDRWLSLEDANAFHAELGREWRIPYEDGAFVIRTTLPRETADEIAKDLRRAMRDVERFFGRNAHDVHLLVLRSVDQYNQFAGGPGGQGGVDLLGWSGVRGAFFADGNWVARDQKYEPMGVALWDLADPNGAAFGRHFSRFAYGIGALERMDPSREARERIAKSGLNDGTVNAFYQEKRIPPVLRYGFASYADRYFVESTAKAGADPHWARRWSVSNLTSQGGLDPLARVLAFQVRIQDEASANEAGKLLNQAGLVVSFVLDGGCEPVEQAHAAWKEALASGDDGKLAKATQALLDAIRKNEPAYRRWAES